MKSDASGLKAPAYNRQRLLLFFLEAIGETVSKMDLQKLLFLYHSEQCVDHYAFVPFRFGCYSFQCTSDLDLMEKRGWIKSKGKELSLARDIRQENWAIRSEERQTVKYWLSCNPKRGDALIAETYQRFPYYALNSEIKNRLLNQKELEAVANAMPMITENKTATVFTLGYEGIRFEEYLNKLIKKQITTLCDVRRNPLSRKFGFSSKMLSHVLPKLNIEYVHLPELGIDSDKRQELNTMADYRQLFAEYRLELPNRDKGLRRLHEIIKKRNRVALTCFEAEAHCCHRHCISDYLDEQLGYTIEHL